MIDNRHPLYLLALCSLSLPVPLMPSQVTDEDTPSRLESPHDREEASRDRPDEDGQ